MSTPAIVQTLTWMLRPPLGLLETLERRYGDVFRLSVYGPRYEGESGAGPLTRRQVTVFSRPEHLEEIFRRSADVLQAGAAQRFLEWFLGAGSLMVLDGPRHRDERHALLALFTADRLEEYERTLQQTAARLVSQWPQHQTVDLGRLVDRALETMNLELALGARADADRLFRVSRKARVAFAAPVLFLPVLRANLGSWSPGGILAQVREGLREIVREPDSGRGPSFLSLLRELPGDESLLLDRLLTLLGGMDNASAAVAWCIRHLVASPDARTRAAAEVRGLGNGLPGPESWLEAVCKESLRLHPPFPVVVRRAVEPVTIGGVTIPAGDFVMGAIYLMHRRADLFPEPTRFLPERFFGQAARPGSYAPFGAGARRCIGTALGTRQLRVLLAEILRQFDLAPSGPVEFRETRRNVTVIPKARLMVRLEPVGASGRPIPGPPHSAIVQAILSVGTSLPRATRLAQRLGKEGIFQIRFYWPQGPGERLPLRGSPIVIASAPALMREIFSRSTDDLAGGEARRFTKWVLGSESLLVLDGEEHREERRRLLTLFTPDRIEAAHAMAQSTIDDALEALPDTGSVALGPWLFELVPRIAMRLMFGSLDRETESQVRRYLRDGLTSVGWSDALQLFPALRQLPFGPGRQASRVLEWFREFLSRQADLTRGGKNPDSWLALLLAMEAGRDGPGSEERRISRVLTILGGVETIGAALQWLFWHLLQHPAILARVSADARSGEGEYVAAACKEACRMNPAIPILSRRVRRPTRLGEYRLEAGSYLIGAIYLTHRLPELYPDPERFMPDRFLSRDYSPWEYLPFGGGVRRCLGQGLGLGMMSQVARAILAGFDVDGRVNPKVQAGKRAVMMVPRDPLRVQVRRVCDKSAPGIHLEASKRDLVEYSKSASEKEIA